MNNTKTGGAAFPRMSHTNCYDTMLPEQDGMDLRDYFAAKALQALMTRDFVKDLDYKGFCNEAYRVADGMLKARVK